MIDEMTQRLDFLAEHQPTHTTVQTLFYLNNFAKEGHWENGFSYEQPLRECQLDYSLASLHRIDQLLDTIRTTNSLDYATFFDNPANTNFLATLGFYCGEMRGRLSRVTPIWLHYPEFIEQNPELQQIFSDPLAYQFVAIYHRTTLQGKQGSEQTSYQHFPWVAIIERLFPEADEPEKSVYFSTLTGNYQQYAENEVLPPAPSQRLDINLNAQIHQLPQEYLAYLQMLPPSWLLIDELCEQMRQLANLYNHGRVVWASLVQANKMLFEYGNSTSCPAELIYDKSGRTPPEQLRDYAHQLFELKHTTPDDPELAEYARHITNERTRFFGKVSDKISHMPLYTATVFVWLPHLPNGVLSRSLFPIVITDDTDEVMILPAIFWQHTSYYQSWFDTQHHINLAQKAEKNDMGDPAHRHLQANARHENAIAYQHLLRHQPEPFEHYEDLLFPQSEQLTLANTRLFDEQDTLSVSSHVSLDEQFLEYCYNAMKIEQARWRDLADLPSEHDIQTCMSKIQAQEQLTLNEFNPTIQILAKLRLFDWQPFLDSLTQPFDNIELPYTKSLPKVALALTQPTLSKPQVKKLLTFLNKASEADFNKMVANEKAGIANITQNNTTALLYLAYLYLVGKFVPQLLHEADNKLRYASGLGDYRATEWIAELLLAVPDIAPILLEQQTLKESTALSMHYMNEMMTGNSPISMTEFDRQRKAYRHNRQAQLEQVRQKLTLAHQQGSPTATIRLQNLITTGKLPPKAPKQRFEHVQFWIMDYVDNTPIDKQLKSKISSSVTTQSKNPLLNWGMKLIIILAIIGLIKGCFFNPKKADTIAQSPRTNTPSTIQPPNTTQTTTPQHNTNQPTPTLYRAVSDIANKIPYTPAMSTTLTLMQIGHNASQTPDIVSIVFRDTSGAIMSIQSAQAIYCGDNLFEPLRQLHTPVKFKIKPTNLPAYEIPIEQCQ